MSGVMENVKKDAICAAALGIMQKCGSELQTNYNMSTEDKINLSQTAKIWCEIYKEMKN